MAEYGADTARVFVLFKAPVEAVLDWDAAAVRGPSRWLGRLWTYAKQSVCVCACMTLLVCMRACVCMCVCVFMPLTISLSLSLFLCACVVLSLAQAGT
jgi:hypothetical protein